MARDDSQIIFVGDPNQLPSVAPGEVLLQLIKSKTLTHEHFDQIFRSAQDSTLNLNAKRVHEGKNLKEADDFQIIDDFSMSDIVDCYMESPGSVQVLCPSWKGDFGVHALNKVIRDAANPSHSDEAFDVGDRVIVTKNNYDIGVINGDVGEVTSVDHSKEGGVYVSFENGFSAKLPWEFADHNIVHAYAVTVHRSQGMEYDRVILVWPPNRWCQYRELFYTAITRGKKEVFIFGDRKKIKDAIRKQDKGNRNSLFWRKLQIASS